jgi:hypothetical protein
VARAGSRSIADPAVAAVFDSAPPPIRRQLLTLRTLILDVAAATPGVGPLVETLKWGQPSYLTEASGSGTTVRIDRVKDAPGKLGLYVNCQTNLIDTFRALYPDALTFSGNRGIMLDAAEPLPADELRHCIALALTYHARKRGR